MKKENLIYNMPQDIPLRFGFYVVNDNSLFLTSFHIHNEIEILYVKKGSLACRFSNTELKLTEEEIIIFNKYFIHETESTPGTEYYVIQIPVELFTNELHQHVYSTTGTSDYIYYKKNDEIADTLKDYIASFFKYSSVKNSVLKEYLLGCTYLIISFLKSVNIISSYDTEDAEKMQKIIPALEYIKNNYKKKITVSDIAKSVNFNPNYFERLFKKTLNTTVIEYINTLRLNKAVNLMFTTNKKLTEISDLCGFSSIVYFNMLFKKQYELPPSTYRKIKTTETENDRSPISKNME